MVRHGKYGNVLWRLQISLKHGVVCLSEDVLSRKFKRPEVRPFVKWAGGKGQILDELIARLPERFSGYVEPFVGGGALFFALSAQLNDFPHVRKIVLNDKNEELVNAYRIIKTGVLELVESLKKHVAAKEYYYKVRAQDPLKLSEVERASRFIFLNKTCYNGLWRVNRKGEFNVPFGRYKNPTILDEANLLNVSKVLQNAVLLNEDFEKAVELAGSGDCVYFDPPYYPVSQTANFTNYVGDGFQLEDQVRLSDVFRRLSRSGVLVMASNSDTDWVREMYREFRLESIQARRAINSRGNRRGPVSELIIMNY